ncbi:MULTISPECIES: hypothetical protein [Mycobacteriales]|uniref:Uncharacterized protein n=1 Tax=Gordonia rubripertincta TaxID=36822 RepID=A0ABT4MQZ8_GORRU|nr:MULTISPECIES: hypothetical protein [Mycobacteriales]MCZ4549428.1 hypothetical protein [Gordonia rubripertincta]
MSASLCGSPTRIAAADAAVPTARRGGTARLTVMVTVPPLDRTSPSSPAGGSDDAQTGAR